jgi:hypothetical protein
VHKLPHENCLQANSYLNIAETYFANGKNKGTLCVFCLEKSALGKSVDLTLYRSHCREMSERMEANQDLRPPTKAEMFVFLKNLSLQTNLSYQTKYMLTKLYGDILGPDQSSLTLDDHFLNNQLIGAFDLLRKKIKTPRFESMNPCESRHS